jgi:hypothetical protein
MSIPWHVTLRGVLLAVSDVAKLLDELEREESLGAACHRILAQASTKVRVIHTLLEEEHDRITPPAAMLGGEGGEGQPSSLAPSGPGSSRQPWDSGGRPAPAPDSRPGDRDA